MANLEKIFVTISSKNPRCDQRKLLLEDGFLRRSVFQESLINPAGCPKIFSSFAHPQWSSDPIWAAMLSPHWETLAGLIGYELQRKFKCNCGGAVIGGVLRGKLAQVWKHSDVIDSKLWNLTNRKRISARSAACGRIEELRHKVFGTCQPNDSLTSNGRHGPQHQR